MLPEARVLQRKRGRGRWHTCVARPTAKRDATGLLDAQWPHPGRASGCVVSGRVAVASAARSSGVHAARLAFPQQLLPHLVQVPLALRAERVSEGACQERGVRCDLQHQFGAHVNYRGSVLLEPKLI